MRSWSTSSRGFVLVRFSLTGGLSDLTELCVNTGVELGLEYLLYRQSVFSLTHRSWFGGEGAATLVPVVVDLYPLPRLSREPFVVSFFWPQSKDVSYIARHSGVLRTVRSSTNANSVATAPQVLPSLDSWMRNSCARPAGSGSR